MRATTMHQNYTTIFILHKLLGQGVFVDSGDTGLPEPSSSVVVVLGVVVVFLVVVGFLVVVVFLVVVTVVVLVVPSVVF